MNQHATIGEAVFSVEAAPRLYNEDLTQMKDRIESPKLAVDRIIEKKRQGSNCAVQKRHHMCAAVTVLLL
jgi:hypothetical protein